MRLLVDTNVLLHAVNSASPRHAEACAALAAVTRRASGIVLTWPIVYEFLRVATHPRVFPTPLTHRQAWAFVEELLSAPACTVVVETPVHAAVLREYAQCVPGLAGNLLHDFHTAVLMREHGVSDVLTLDADFRAFPGLRIRTFADASRPV